MGQTAADAMLRAEERPRGAAWNERYACRSALRARHIMCGWAGASW